MIRSANKWDFDALVHMLRQFNREANPVLCDHFDNEPYIRNLLTQIVSGRGILLVAEREDQVVGMAIGFISPTIWDPDALILNELAYYIQPEHRGGTLGYRLLDAYIRECESLKQQGRVLEYNMILMTTSPNIKLERWGLHPVQRVYMSGLTENSLNSSKQITGGIN